MSPYDLVSQDPQQHQIRHLIRHQITDKQIKPCPMVQLQSCFSCVKWCAVAFLGELWAAKRLHSGRKAQRGLSWSKLAKQDEKFR